MKAAREAAKRAIELDAGCARAHALLGVIALRADKKVDPARKHLRKAKELDRNMFSARLYLGVIAAQKEETDEAIEEFEAARRIYPRFSRGSMSPYLHLATLYAKKGDPEKAVTVLRDLIEMDAADLRALVKLGEILAEAGKPAEAAEAYLGAIYIDPYDPAIHEAAAKAYKAAGRDADAKREREIAALLRDKS